MPADHPHGSPHISRRTALRIGITAALVGPTIARVARVQPYERLKGLDLVASTAASPSEVGQWTAPIPGPEPVIAVHAVLLRTGAVLMVEGKTAYVWNPITGEHKRVDPPKDLFCAGQAHLANGTVLFVGGYLGPQGENLGPRWNHTFDPVNLTWTKRVNSRRGRWYPTTTRLPNGKVLITGGTGEDTEYNTDVDLYSSNTLTKIGSRLMEFYPLQQVVKTGRVLAMAPDIPGSTYSINVSERTFKVLPAAGVSRAYAAGVLLPAGPSGSTKMMVIGGANHVLDGNGVYTEPHASVQVFDAANPTAGWRPRASLPEPRLFTNVVILPDGTLLAVGGETAGVAVRNAALYDPRADSWRSLAAQAEVRSYHSTAVLLPDGRVLSCGDNHPGGGGDKLEIFSPPYLFRGPRPVITGAPAKVKNLTSFTIGTDRPVARAVLVAPGATTHSFDMNQRHVELAFTTVTGGIKANTPGIKVALPGFYMLFVLDADGVPSVARWIQVYN
jgi:hypothetical protein